MATSTNFGWTEPDDTDLVKNGASAMRTLGNAIDSTLWTVGGYTAGKNKIINGDFGIWQRGTSFSTPAINAYLADRWYQGQNGTGATVTWSQQSFTAGSAPTTGYEATYFLRNNQTVAGTGATFNFFGQKIEDVRTFAGQTVTVSFWAKASASNTLNNLDFAQDFGSGGSGTVATTFGSGAVLTTSWQRFSYTVAVPSITGKTIGTGSSLTLRFYLKENTVQTFDVWGVQVEAGSTATPFQTATGTKQGELAACQRYYTRFGGTANYTYLGAIGNAAGATTAQMMVTMPVTMRSAPSAIEYSTTAVYDGNAITAATTIGFSYATPATQFITITSSGMTTARSYQLIAQNSTSGYLAFSAEL